MCVCTNNTCVIVKSCTCMYVCSFSLTTAQFEIIRDNAFAAAVRRIQLPKHLHRKPDLFLRSVAKKEVPVVGDNPDSELCDKDHGEGNVLG